MLIASLHTFANVGIWQVAIFFIRQIVDLRKLRSVAIR